MNSDLLVSETSQEMLPATAPQTCEARYQDLFENVRDIVFTLNSRGDFTSPNAAWERSSGSSREESLGMNFADIVAPGDPQSVRAVIDWREQNRPISREIEIILNDGRRL